VGPGQLVAIFMFVCAGLVGVYDIFCIFNPAKCATASYWVQTWSRTNPLIPLACGALIGHLFFGTVCPARVASELKVLQQGETNDASKLGSDSQQ